MNQTQEKGSQNKIGVLFCFFNFYFCCLLFFLLLFLTASQHWWNTKLSSSTHFPFFSTPFLPSCNKHMRVASLSLLLFLPLSLSFSSPSFSLQHTHDTNKSHTLPLSPYNFGSLLHQTKDMGVWSKVHWKEMQSHFCFLLKQEVLGVWSIDRVAQPP